MGHCKAIHVERTQPSDLFSSVQEYQENEQTLVVEEGQINQTVNLYKCNKCTIQIKGKVNAVTLGELSLPILDANYLLLSVVSHSRVREDLRFG